MKTQNTRLGNVFSNEKEKQTKCSIRQAIEDDNVETLKSLLDRNLYLINNGFVSGSKASSIDISNQGVTPLCYAVYLDRIESTRLLIEMGADIYYRISPKENIPEYVTRCGSSAILELLLNKILSSNMKGVCYPLIITAA